MKRTLLITIAVQLLCHSNLNASRTGKHQKTYCTSDLNSKVGEGENEMRVHANSISNE